MGTLKFFCLICEKSFDLNSYTNTLRHAKTCQQNSGDHAKQKSDQPASKKRKMTPQKIREKQEKHNEVEKRSKTKFNDALDILRKHVDAISDSKAVVIQKANKMLSDMPKLFKKPDFINIIKTILNVQDDEQLIADLDGSYTLLVMSKKPKTPNDQTQDGVDSDSDWLFDWLFG